MYKKTLLLFSFFVFLTSQAFCSDQLSFQTDYRAANRASRIETESKNPGRGNSVNTEERLQKAESAKKQYEKNMSEFKANKNLGVHVAETSICASNPEEVDWLQMNPAAARGLAQKMAKNMERVGCLDEANAYMNHVLALVGEPEDEVETE